MDPRTGQILTVAGRANTQAAIGTPIPGLRQPAQRHPPGRRRHREDRLHVADARPRSALRRGLRPDRQPDHDPRAPAAACSTTVRTATPCSRSRATRRSRPRPTCATASCRRVGQGLSLLPVPQLVTFQYDAKVPAQWQWQAGVQRALPWAMAIDLSYVGNHGYNRLGALQGGTTVNLNAVDIGAAYLPENQDPTHRQPSTRARRQRLHDNLLRPYPRLRQHQPEHHRVLGHLSLASRRR